MKDRSGDDSLYYTPPAPTPAEHEWTQRHIIPFLGKRERRVLYGDTTRHVAEVFTEEASSHGMDAAGLAAAAGIPEGDAQSLLATGLAPMRSFRKAAQALKIEVVAYPPEMVRYL